MSEIKSQFFNGKTYSATDFVESNKNTMKDGILPNTDFFKVLPASNMTIGVASGRGWVKGHAFSSDSTLAFTLDRADGVLDRVDTVVIRLDLTTDSEKIECRVIKGALGGSATAPVRNGTYYDLVVAQIAVAHGTTAITAAMITDKRGDGNLCGWGGAISGDQFNFDEKATYTYVDTEIAKCVKTATLTAYQLTITNGTMKTNADRLQGYSVSTNLSGGGVLKVKGSNIVAIIPNKQLATGGLAQTITTITNADFLLYDAITISVYGTTGISGGSQSYSNFVRCSPVSTMYLSLYGYTIQFAFSGNTLTVTAPSGLGDVFANGCGFKVMGEF